MNLKRLKIFTLMVIVGGLVFTACQDSFNEEDFLNKQYSLDTAQQARQVEALNDAGRLLSFTVQVMEDGSPLVDADVSISNANGTGSTTVRTGPSGTAIFSDVAVGGNTVVISKANYITASVTVDFGVPANGTHFIIDNNGKITPIKQNASIQVPLISKNAAATSTATIKGNITIDTDVTTAAADVQYLNGLKIKANFNASAALNNFIKKAGTVTVGTYFFTEGDLGVANVAVSGNVATYTMTVPAFSDGFAFTLDIPTIEGKQRIAVNTVENVDLDNVGPEFRDVDVVWGPGITYDAVPTVAGVRAVFSPSAPSAPGRGFNATFAPVGRSLDGGTIDETSEILGNTTYAINSRGSDYTASPSVDVSGITGADDGESTLRGFVKSVTITSGGTGYPASATLRVHLGYNDGADKILPSPAGGVFVTVTTDASGVITNTGAIALPNSAGFIGNSTPFITGEDVGSFKVLVTNTTNVIQTPTTAAVIAIPNTNELNSVRIVNTGSGFTSAPTITLGGTSATAAAVIVSSFKKQFDITLGTAATTAYKIKPNGISFFYPATGTDIASTEIAAKVDRVTPIGFVQNNNANFIDMLTTNGTNLVAIELTNTLRTDKFWAEQPVITVQDATIAEAKATTITLANGTISTITGITAGSGYDAPLTVAIAPLSSTAIVGTNVVTHSAPGSGATVDLTDVTNNITTKAFAWGGTLAIQTKGSGYVTNANQKAQENFSATTAVTVKPGNTHVIDIKYGTGDVKVNVQ